MNAPILHRRGPHARADLQRLESPIRDWRIEPSRSAGQPFDTRLRQFADTLVVDARVSRGCTGVRRNAATGFVAIMFIADGRESGAIGTQRLGFDRGDVVVWNSQQANLQFEVTETLRKIMIFLPDKRVRSLWPDLISPSILRLPHESALSPLLAGYFNAFASQLDTLADPHASTAVDVGAELVARAARAQSERCDIDQRSVTIDSAIRYLETNLRDPDLNADRVAAHFGVSTRYLQILFARQGMTVSEWIRQRRLDACRYALQCKTPHETITKIAFTWGFNDSSHFTRLFRQRFGIAPKAYARRYTAT